MSQSPQESLSQAFCSYCGHPPSKRWRVRPHRVCMRCELGMVLRAPAGAEPRHDDPFLILDRRLTVQAVSRQAEVVLLVDEPAGVGAPLDAFLASDNGDPSGAELARLVELAAMGAPPSKPLALRTVGIPEIRLQGRVTSCGPPPGALLILTALPAEASPPPNPGLSRNGTSLRRNGQGAAA